jgi:hypothetical protein
MLATLCTLLKWNAKWRGSRYAAKKHKKVFLHHLQVNELGPVKKLKQSHLEGEEIKLLLILDLGTRWW